MTSKRDFLTATDKYRQHQPNEKPADVRQVGYTTCGGNERPGCDEGIAIIFLSVVCTALRCTQHSKKFYRTAKTFSALNSGSLRAVSISIKPVTSSGAEVLRAARAWR